MINCCMVGPLQAKQCLEHAGHTDPLCTNYLYTTLVLHLLRSRTCSGPLRLLQPQWRSARVRSVCSGPLWQLQGLQAPVTRSELAALHTCGGPSTLCTSSDVSRETQQKPQVRQQHPAAAPGALFFPGRLE
jgi:hypothetical protein